MLNGRYNPEKVAATIAEQHDKNENFHGRRANFQKLQLFQVIKHDLEELAKHCDEVRDIDGYKPNEREKHAVLWIDLRFAATFDKNETAMLTAVMNKADGTVVSATDGHVRISFWVNDVWDE